MVKFFIFEAKNAKKWAKIRWKWRFFGIYPAKKRVFLQSNFNFLQNMLERWYGHGRKCVTLLRSWILLFWKSRADRSICARARAPEIWWKAQKMAENHQKNRKKSIFSKKNFFVNKRPWKFFKCFGHVFRSFVTCKVFWSDLILVKSVSTVSPINVIWSENVIFKCFDTGRKLWWS